MTTLTLRDRASIAHDFNPQERWSALLLFVIVQAAGWIAVPATIFNAPESNTMELALWARDWFIVNYKHPGLPAWLLEIAYNICGTHVWVSLLLAQLCICAAYIFVFLIGRALLGEAPALLGTLLLPAVNHFTLDALSYNHNVVQLPLWIGFCYFLWRAAADDRLVWWLLAATLAALGLYAKFTMLLIVAFGAVWMLLDDTARARLNGRNIYAAAMVFLVLTIPLDIALGATHFGSLSWVTRESAQRGIPGLVFLRDIGRVVLIMAGALVVGVAANRVQPRAVAVSTPAPDRRVSRFLLVMGAGPMLLTLMLAFVKPSRVEWAAPMYSMIGLLLVAGAIRLVPKYATWIQGGMRQALIATAASLIILGNHMVSAVDNRETAHVERPLWPAAEMATRFDHLWRTQTGRPLQIVGGDSWVAGAVGWLNPSRPSLFVNLDRRSAPAITRQRLQTEGMLVVWTARSTWRPDPTLVAEFPNGTETFADSGSAAGVAVNYVLIAPGVWTDDDWERWSEHDGPK